MPAVILEIHWIESNLLNFKVLMDKFSENFVVTHVHANNYGDVFVLDGHIIPSVLEVVFLNKKYFELSISKEDFYLDVVDVACCPVTPEYRFSFIK